MPQFVSNSLKRTPSWKPRPLEICQKKLFPVCFFTDKVVSNINQIYTRATSSYAPAKHPASHDHEKRRAWFYEYGAPRALRY